MGMMNRFISVHALGFVFYNMVHLTNWIINGLPERFPKLKLMWIESGLAWVPFMMQRLRQRIHDALVGSAGAEEAAERLHARHVLLDAADGDRPT